MKPTSTLGGDTLAFNVIASGVGKSGEDPLLRSKILTQDTKHADFQHLYIRICGMWIGSNARCKSHFIE